LGKKGTKRIPRDPSNQRNAHPNPGGGGGPSSDPSPLQARRGNTDRGVLLAAATSLVAGGEDAGLGVSLAAASVSASAAILRAAFSTASRRGGVLALLLICVLPPIPTPMRMTQRHHNRLRLGLFHHHQGHATPPLWAPKMFSMPA
jgi:hypothetical protein